MLGDALVKFLKKASFKKYPEKLRLVKFHDSKQNGDFSFLTNDFFLPSLKVTALYKNRCQVELFFKWLKQHPKIKKFWGIMENAVRIQVCVAIITYCLVSVVLNELKRERSIYKLLQILSVSLTDKPHTETVRETRDGCT